MDEAIQVKGLSVSYHGVQAVKNISFSVKKGSLVGLIGPNGAGKSTLLKALLNLIPIDAGKIMINGGTVKENRKAIAYVPQRSLIDWTFPITVLDTVLLGTYPSIGLFKRPKKTEKEWAFQCLKRVGLESYSTRQIGELSGGQQQRVFLARALAQKADLLFLDEPFVGIDMSSEEAIMEILKDLIHSGKTIVVVHHDLNKVIEYFDQVVLINKELIGFGESERVLRSEILLKAYTKQVPFLNQLEVKL
ncbi:MAG TPA: metal ABC transporter ATP-binding protein [Bacillus sp. (in: firmicutes)]|uniref:metal ABC transporter ATP-binding protein n=1 Tax=Bacillus litorisediminis TaxID=2922713 RepID=UPI001FAD6905|nr:metal ABC transporter ATP-binding protein [Bacillus litorisediminis]HWO76330.1 metal ABC transporter ATP-binding protein [Bacillus sp. (in: firmicutes)]